MSAFGGTTPIHTSYPPFLWADHPVVRNAWTDMGVRAVAECARGDKEGLCWIPASKHPETSRHSHAALGHYSAVNETRENYEETPGDPHRVPGRHRRIRAACS